MCPGYGGDLSAGATAVRAAVVTAARRAEVVTVQLPPLAAGSLRVEVDGCGVCGSNLPVWEGRPWFSYPLPPGALGHEAWGRVAAHPAGAAADFPVGTRVAFLSDNAFAEVVDVPAGLVVPIPAAVEGPFPGEALGCALNIAGRSGFAAGDTVAIVGAGFLGCLIVALAARAGARVIALSRRASALDAARSMGAKETVRLPDSDSAVEEVERLTSGRLCDVVVEAVGAQGPLDLAARLTKVRGRLVVAGFHQDGARSVDLQLWNWRGIDVVNAHERDDAVRLAGIRAAAEVVASGALDPTPLYTHRFPLAELDAALNTLVARPTGFMKSLVVR